MKWRQVDKAVADKLTFDTWWECSMNEDQRFNACNIPEQDLKSFDKQAQQAKLVVFKSELVPGSLVWAKTPGYCNWPALVSVDPANDEFREGDEEEPEKGYYHVEYLGKSHCHLWVYSKSVELFGRGNVSLASQKTANLDSISNQLKSRKRKRAKIHQMKKREKRSYGGGSVEIAIKEAMTLLPLPLEERLKFCKFRIENESSFSKTKSAHLNMQQKKTTERRGRPSQANLKARQLNNKRQKTSETDLEWDPDDTCSWASPKRKNNHSYDFLTSLIDITMEERFFLDISVYKEKERNFHENLEDFCSHFSLPKPCFLVWHDTKINLFDLFLAVNDRGGFEKVSNSHQWSHVHFELTNFPSKGGASKAKSTFKKYLYPYELYIEDKDYSSAMSYAIKCTRNSKQISPKNMSSQKSRSEIDGGSDMDNAEFMQALNELDDLLQSLKGKDAVVPDMYGQVNASQGSCEEEIVCDWELHRSPEKDYHLQSITGSELGIAVEPEESAQVVPEMDFPSFSGSSTPSGSGIEYGRGNDRILPQLQEEDNEEEWVLQELQALEHNL